MEIPNFIHCEACGMPMMNEEDFGGGDPENDWCCYCCNADGSHKSFEELVEGQGRFLMTPQGEEISGEKYTNQKEARRAARSYLSKQDAFKNEH